MEDKNTADEASVLGAIPAPTNASTGDTGGPGDGTQKTRQTTTPTELLLNICDKLQLAPFNTPDGTEYLTIPTKSRNSDAAHLENRAIDSSDFRNFLKREFYNVHRKAPSEAAVEAVIGILKGKAQFDSPTHPIFVRVAGDEKAIYLDLADEQWRVVRVTAEGWEVLDRSLVKFRRPKGMKALPVPERGGSIDELRKFINVRDDDQFRLVVGFLLASLRPKGPYPILEVNGEQGSAKSTLCDFVRSLVDPNEASKKSGPKNERDLAIGVSNSWLSLFDNMSKITDEMSDALCRISTGGAFSTRKLYANDEEQIFSFTRPLIVNGIEELATRPDLLERTLVLDLPRVKATERKDLDTLGAAFTAARPRLLGALLDAVVGAMRAIPTVEDREWPRLADAAKWVTAAEAVLGWEPGSFLATLDENRQDSAVRALAASEPLSSAVRALAQGAGWTGTATSLLDKLRWVNQSQRWPVTPNALSGQLRRLAPAFRELGVDVSFYKQGEASTKLIDIRQTRKNIAGVAGIDRSEAA